MCAAIWLLERIVVVIANGKCRMAELVPNDICCFALNDGAARGVTPQPLRSMPGNHCSITTANCPRLRGVRISPLARNVLRRLELHFTKFLPHAGLVVTRISAQQQVVLGCVERFG